jgi:hypothetical protein
VKSFKVPSELIFTGAHFLAEKMMVKMSPTVTIKVEDEGTYRLHTKTQVKNFEWIFKLGQEVSLPTPDGTRTVKMNKFHV